MQEGHGSPDRATGDRSRRSRTRSASARPPPRRSSGAASTRSTPPAPSWLQSPRGTTRSGSATCTRWSTASGRGSPRASGLVHHVTTSTVSRRLAVAVLVLREAGAHVEWRVPSRFEEGYGRPETIEQLADRASISPDGHCGSRRSTRSPAHELGLDVVVTDHHRPGETLPTALLSPRARPTTRAPSGGTGVVYTLARALLGDDHPVLGRVLDLSPWPRPTSSRLSTRTARLVASGLGALAPSRPGLKALMRTARVDPAAIDATADDSACAEDQCSRPARAPDLALELSLADDPAVARELAGTLEDLNRERQGVEERILRQAVARVESLPRSGEPAGYPSGTRAGTRA